MRSPAKLGQESTAKGLLRHIRTTRDGDFSRKRPADAYVSELAHQLGNLVQRTLALIARARGGVIPAPPEGRGERLELECERELGLHVEAVAREVAAAVEGFALHEALESIWRLVGAANATIDQTAPWTYVELERTQGRQPRLDQILYTLLDVIRAVAQFLEPFLPTTAHEILRRLGHEDFAARLPRPGELQPGRHVVVDPPLFPKLPGLT